MEGWGWQSVHDPDELPRVLDRWKASIATGELFDMTFPLRGADGVFRPFLTRIMPLKDKEGRVIRWFGTNTDVSDRVRVERSLGRLAAIVESSDDAILSTDLIGIIQTWNAGAERLFGYRAEEVIGRPMTVVMPSERIREEEQILDRVRSGRSVEHLETIRVTKDGIRLEVSVTVSPVKDQEGHIIGSSKIVHDISNRKRAEDALRKSEQEFRTLAEAMPQIVWATRPDGWNVYFNQKWVDYTGMTLDESYGHGWNTPFHPDDKQRAWDAWQRATQHNEPYLLECRLRRADGAYRWWLIHGTPYVVRTVRFRNGSALAPISKSANGPRS